MIQFYVLSILVNLFVGLYLYLSDGSQEESADYAIDSENENEKTESVKKPGFKKFFFGPGSVTDDSLFLLVFGGLALFISLVKLFSPVDGIVVFGDLFPVLAGICCGVSLLLEYFDEGEASSLPGFLQIIFVDFKRILGLVCVVVSLVHFIIPGVLFF